MKQKITRIGVYGIVTKENHLLVVKQEAGPYANKFDFPGGGIEFGESPEETLRRELSEEVSMTFDSLQLIDNLTATIEARTTSGEPFTFFHIGMLYRLEGCRSTNETHGALQSTWIDPKTLSKDHCSSLLWKYLEYQLNSFQGNSSRSLMIFI